MLKNKSYVAINIIGLSLSLACCIVGYLNYQYAATYDGHHENLDRIYKIQVQKDVQGRKVSFGITPLPLGNEMVEKRSEVDKVSRYAEMWPVFKKDTRIFNDQLAFADPDYFDIFTFPLQYGSLRNFDDPTTIYLTEEAAEKYFQKKDATGEFINIVVEDNIHSFQVGGVLENMPHNSSMQFEAITSFDNYLKFNNTENSSWNHFIAATFFMTEKATYPSEVEKWLNNSYIEVQNSARDNWKVANYYLEPFSEFNKNAESLRSQWLDEPPPKPAITVPFIMAILMLLIACFNFTNTSMAISSKRLKEIGLRKVMGGNKRQLVAQFMGENIILTLFALLIGVGVAYFLAPAYSAMWGFIDLKVNIIEDPELFGFLAGLLIFTSVIAGVYPAFYVSSFQPVRILRGTVKIGTSSFLSKALLSSQFLLTIVALIASLAFLRNAHYQKSLDVGYNNENVLWSRVNTQSEFDRFSTRVAQLPNVKSAVGTEEHVSAWTYGRTLKHADREIEADMLDLGVEYMSLMDIKVKEGRFWDKDLYEFDKENSIIVNETLVNDMGWEEPLGKYLQVDDSTRLTVVGVMKDLHMWGFFDPINPMGVRPAKDDQYNFVIVKTTPGKALEVKEEMEKIWYEIEPNKPFHAGLQNEYLEETLLVNKNIVTMFSFIGLLALILSVIGMYTLVSLSIIKRVKEIGVRKVLGAQVHQIIMLMNSPFYWVLLIAAILGGAASYFAINALMESVFAYYLPIDAVSLIVPVVVMAIVALSISSGRIFRAAVQNPVKSLRYE